MHASVRMLAVIVLEKFREEELTKLDKSKIQTLLRVHLFGLSHSRLKSTRGLAASKNWGRLLNVVSSAPGRSASRSPCSRSPLKAVSSAGREAGSARCPRLVVEFLGGKFIPLHGSAERNALVARVAGVLVICHLTRRPAWRPLVFTRVDAK